MVLQHTPLPSAVPVPGLTSGEQGRSRVSCWHILSVALTVVSSAFACLLGARGLTFYLNADLVVEECTANWNFDFPCHYLLLWIKFNDPERVYDTRWVIIAISLFLVVVASLFLVKKAPYREIWVILYGFNYALIKPIKLRTALFKYTLLEDPLYYAAL